MAQLGESRTIGNYRLIRPLGEGGMGEVFLAQRDSDFNKQVAIKLIRAEVVKPDIIRRFTIERQTLAALNHPSIVHLLDGGTTDDGLPYLVTDFVEGIPLDRYCGDRRLCVAERLRLFLQVCGAVHHAHQQLVVHCDLKPANILVTPQGVPMLLDFGIAKLLDPAAVGVTMKMSGETRAGFTPQYASPEQMLGLPVSTATDTYALGVILYELLTGRSPHSLKGSMAEWLRSICEGDAPAPSTAIRNPGGPLVQDIASLERQLRGDLDAIILKALRKEPRDRYASVDQMAEDVRRHLDGRPVSARKNTTQYVVRKFLARHKLSVAAAAVVLFAVLGGVASTLWQARIAAQRFDDVRSLAKVFLFDVHDSIQDLPGSTAARSLIARTGTEYLDRLAQGVRGDPQLGREVAEGYLKVGDVEGNPYNANLGDTAKAIASYRKALAVASSGGADNRQLLARIHENLASVLPFDGKAQEGLEQAQQAVALYRELANASPANVEAKLDLARGLEAQGDLEGGARGINLGRLADATKSYQSSLQLIPDLPAGHASAARAMRARAVLLTKLGDMHDTAMQQAAALEQYQQALALAEQLALAEPNNARARNLVPVILNKIASTYMSLGNNAAAEETYRRVIALNEAALAGDPNNERARTGLAAVQKNLGDLYYYNLHRFPDALRQYRTTAQLLEAAIKSDPANIVWQQNLSEALTYVASVLIELKQPGEARPYAMRGLAIAKQLADRTGASHDQIYNYAWLGITIEPADLRDARAVLPYARKAVELSGGKNPFDLHVLAQTQAALGDMTHAVESEERALALFPPLSPGQPVPGARQTIEGNLAEYRQALNGGATAAPPTPAARAVTKAVVVAVPEIVFKLEDWLSMPGWVREGSGIKHRGGEFLLASPELAEGTIEFTVTPVRGKEVEWTLRYRDLKNYDLFQIGDGKFVRYSMTEGRRSPAVQVAVPKAADYRVRVLLRQGNATHSIFRDGDWRPLDQWDDTSNTGPGRFGFHVPGRDEIAVSEFRMEKHK